MTIYRIAAFVVATALTVAVLAIASEEFLEAQSGTCYLGAHFFNKDKYIGRNAVISAECPPSIHTPPWGNWGVRSRHGGARNTNQFRGWKSIGTQRQWNSCTTHSDYDAPDPFHYNRPAGEGWWQESEPYSEERYESAWVEYGERGETCESKYDGIVWTTEDVFMKLYELDSTGDQLVATLEYGDLRIRLDCNSAWDCSGNSGWRSKTSLSPSSSRVSARVFVLAQTDRK